MVRVSLGLSMQPRHGCGWLFGGAKWHHPPCWSQMVEGHFFLISAFKKWIMFMSTIFLDSVRLSRSFRPAQVLQIQINAGIIYPKLIDFRQTTSHWIYQHKKGWYKQAPQLQVHKLGFDSSWFFCYPSRYSKQQRSKAACTIWVINPPATEDLGDSQSRSAFSTLRYPLQSNMAMGNSWNTWLWLPLFQIYIYVCQYIYR